MEITGVNYTCLVVHILVAVRFILNVTLFSEQLFCLERLKIKFI